MHNNCPPQQRSNLVSDTRASPKRAAHDSAARAARRLSTCFVAVTVAASLICAPARAHKVEYVDELEIVSRETWLHNAFSAGIEKGASTTVDKVLSSIGQSILGGFMDSYVPGLSSVLGLGGGEQSAKPILDAINASTVQLADRMRRLSQLVGTLHSTQLSAYYAAGESHFEQFMSFETVGRRARNMGLLDEAEDNLELARFEIEATILEAHKGLKDISLQTIEYIHTHIALCMLIATVIAERSRVTVLEAEREAAGFNGSAEDFLLSLDMAGREAVDAEVLAQIQATNSIVLGGNRSVFNFYARVASEGILRAEVDSWFSPLTHPTDCWDDTYDASFDLPEYYQDAEHWGVRCCDTDWVEFPSTHERCLGFSDIFWYYYVRAPNAACYRRSHELFDQEDAEECNRFFVRDVRAIIGSYDGYEWYKHSDEMDVYNDHKNDVYAAFAAKIYGPVAVYLDSLWMALGKNGTRPRTSLDSDLDYVVTDVPGLPESNIMYGVPQELNFVKFPGWSTSVVDAVMR